jgi:outer membrane protein assembly factor BamC
LLTVLPKAGLPIESSAQSQGLIVFNYEGDASTGVMQILTFWEPVEPTEGLALSSGKYRLQLADRGNETSITLLDDSNKPVLASAVERLYQRLQKYTHVSANVIADNNKQKAVAQPDVSEKPIHLANMKDKWVADAPADKVLNRMSADLPQLGWTIKQTDVAEQRIAVEYKVPEGSLLDALAIWKPLAPNYTGLSSGSYVFQLHQMENGTQVELLTASQQAVPAATAEQVYRALAKKLLSISKP